MKFVPKFTVTADATGDNLIITDISGLYNPLVPALGHLNGYGSPDVCAIGDGLGPFDLNDMVSLVITVTETVGFTTVLTKTLSRSDLPATYTGDFIIDTLAFPLPSGTYNVGIAYTFTCGPDIAPVQSITVVKGPYPEDDIEGNLNICMSNSCNLLEIEECTSTPTSVCDPQTNGWSYDPTVNPDVERVYIEIWDYAKGCILDTIYLIDKTVTPIINVFPSPITGKFDLPDYTFNFGDGVYEFRYIVDVARPFQPNYQVEIGNFINTFYCNAKACVDALFEKALFECDANSQSDLMQTALDAQILFLGVVCNQACLDLTKAEEIRKTLIEICEIAKCSGDISDCGCGCN